MSSILNFSPQCLHSSLNKLQYFNYTSICNSGALPKDKSCHRLSQTFRRRGEKLVGSKSGMLVFNVDCHSQISLVMLSGH